MLTDRGIDGDSNARLMSPRQVLVTRLEDLASFNIHPGDLRENLIVEKLSEAILVPGSVLLINNEVRIRLTFFCEPCNRISHLVSPYTAIHHRRGVLGVVLAGGNIRTGDEVRVIENVYHPLPQTAFERFVWFVSRVPAGTVVTYSSVTIGIGVPRNFVRAIPSYIKRAVNQCPVHRIVDTDGALVQYVDSQVEKLAREGVQVATDKSGKSVVDVQMYSWLDERLFTRTPGA